MKETELKIHIYGDKVVRQKSLLVKEVTEEERKLFGKMADIMYKTKGVGLAAVQIGIKKQLIVIDFGQGLFKFANPKIIEREDLEVMEEGCLSIPGVTVKVKRAKRVFVEVIDEFNRKLSFWAEGLYARVLQHEMDHLRGKLIIDYAGPFKKIKIARMFKKKLKLSVSK